MNNAGEMLPAILIDKCAKARNDIINDGTDISDITDRMIYSKYTNGMDPTRRAAAPAAVAKRA